MTDREAAAQWARDLLSRIDWCVLDTETTGLGMSAQIVQLALIDPDGAVLLDTLVKPTHPIPPDATHIHGITDAMVADAPTFDQVWPRLLRSIAGRELIIYNANFDREMLTYSRAAAGGAYYDDIAAWWRRFEATKDETNAATARWSCAMHWYSQWYGAWSEWHGSYTWQKLPGGDHSALGDARACLAVIRRMADSEQKEESA